ncbi:MULTISPECIES: ABC transporter substrate-binding protein [unclassified Polaromonas]|jgi:NitT/TauT family transport system substrate-binding protein|uniref:ABC transporter substrate-binding protein n=1 Tax=unclassified Polaromonas TaxID=2638319 RepID=UPI0018CB1F1A|nr:MULTISPECIES: ABC transporter substrate-binding protein [unclassified Polaromonas]MBG6073371.1 NitT/TauT family transport system substrate-binding protein [Polaromonas sp. CG_9.7]MBG6115290.1 NitT/TauT family transport system substrate-binding protein [Polaromonas sp. CG_9.2]MDH6183007.1 NitT/TauT family transport system substrate-binding protein [Polaromonas sp. CG_23.6]
MTSSGFSSSRNAAPSLLGRLFKPALGLAVALAAASAFAAGPASMKIGTVVWIGYGPFYVADALDLYKKYNLKVSLQVFNDPALIPSAMASGALDGAMLTYDQVVGQVAGGKAQKVVMPIDYSNGGDAIVAESSITKVTDFKGKKVGFNPLSPSDFLLSYALKTNGMTDKDIVAVNMTPEGVPAAMASGQMPIGVTYEPSLSQILGQGDGKKFKVVFSSRNAPGLIADVLVFDDKAIKAKPAEIAGIMKAYLDGLAYMKAKPDESARIIGKFMGVSAKEVKEQLLGVYNIPLAEMPKAFVKAKETTSYFASGEIIGQLLKAKGQITAVPPIETTFDAQFVTALTKK